MNKIMLIAVIAALIIGGGIFYFTLYQTQSIAPTTLSVDKAALTRLQTDLQKITPNFINENKVNNGEPLTPEEQKITDDVVAVFVSGQPSNAYFYSGLWLEAIGKRYILLSQPSAESSRDVILDSQTGMNNLIGGDTRFYLASKGRNVAVYINSENIYTYTLDQSSGVLVPGSQLSGIETYDSGAADFLDVNAVESHTINSITISVFDTSKRVPNPALGKGATMNGKVREVTLSF